MVLAEDALVPELSSQTLGPGSRITGVVGFVMPEGRVPARILYQPESSRIIPLQDLSGEEPPALGEAVSIVDSEGGTGSVTVTEGVDPFEDVDPTQTPPEDGRFVLVNLVYENTGRRPVFRRAVRPAPSRRERQSLEFNEHDPAGGNRAGPRHHERAARTGRSPLGGSCIHRSGGCRPVRDLHQSCQRTAPQSPISRSPSIMRQRRSRVRRPRAEAVRTSNAG